MKLDANYQPALSLLEAIDPSFTPPETQTTTPPEPDPSVDPQPNAKPRQEIYYELGIVYRDSKMHTEAIVEFQKAIDLDPDFVAAHISLGKAYLEVGQLDAAENAAKAALRIDANSQPARQLLDDIRQVRRPRQARRNQQDILLHTPDAKKHCERGEAYLNNKQYSEAAAAFKRAIKAGPNFADAYCGLGIAYLEMGALDDAKTAVEAASRLKANRQLVHELLTTIKRAETSLHKREHWKKWLAYAVVLGITVVAALVIYNIVPNPRPEPPKFSIAPSLSVPYLFAGKTAILTLTVKNSGGTAHNVKINLEPKNKAGLNYEHPAPIPIMGESGEEKIKIRITTDKDIRTRKETVKIELSTDDGIEPVTKNFDLQIFGTEQ